MTDRAPDAAPDPATPATGGVVQDVVVPVAQAAVGGVVSAAVQHVAATVTAPKATSSKPAPPAE